MGMPGTLAPHELVELYNHLTPGERAELDRLLRDTPQDFVDWLEETTPQWTWRWKYQAMMHDILQRVTDGTLTQVMFFLPPRHGKSEMTTVRYPIYRMQRDPSLRIIIGAYNHLLAVKFSRKARRIAKDIGIPLSLERTSVDDWETTEEGGLRAAGVGGGVTGMGGDLIIIDDPVKSREEANSLTYRDKVWDWYTDDLFSRREPGAAIILIMTRWHGDDLAGRILESDEGENWTVLSLEGANTDPNDPLGRPIWDEHTLPIPKGCALCPQRYDEEALAKIWLTMGNFGFSSLYQQRPRPREGNMFPRDQITYVKGPPADEAVRARIRYWDRAGTAGAGKYTAGCLMSLGRDDKIYVEDVERFRFATGPRDKRMKEVGYRDGKAMRIWVEQEPGSSGKESIQAFIKFMKGYKVWPDRVTGSKEDRAEPFAASWQNGDVVLVKGKWNKAFLDELETFPNGTYSDQTDSASGAFAKITQGSVAVIGAPQGLTSPSPWGI